jgi:nitrogen regulatory protein PII
VPVDRGVVTYVPEFGYRTKIEVVVSDTLAEAIVNDVLKLLGTGSSAVSKIFIYDIKEAYDLGTREEEDLML